VALCDIFIHHANTYLCFFQTREFAPSPLSHIIALYHHNRSVALTVLGHQPSNFQETREMILIIREIATPEQIEQMTEQFGKNFIRLLEVA